MKILHLYGIAAMLLFLGVILYIVRAQLLVLAWVAIAGGIGAALIGLFRFFAPGYIQMLDAHHEQWKSTADLQLRANMLALAQRPGYGSKFDANGSIEIIPPARATHATLPPALPKEDISEQAEQAIPAHVRYEDIANQIPRGHGLLGVSANSVETADFQEFMTMLISGGSNSGKSNTVGLKLHEAIANGRDIRLLVIDWHARKADSLYNKIKCYESRFIMPVVMEEEDTLSALQWFYEEFKRRRSMGVSAQDNDVLLVVDEVPAIMDAEDKEIAQLLKLIARKCGRESRGFGMYGWFIAQQMIGLSWLRNVVHTVIGHKATRINEAEIVCNDHRDIARDMENWPQGRVIVYGQNFTGVKVLQMPIFVPESFSQSSTVPETHRNTFRPHDNASGYDVPTVPDETPELASEHEKQRIISPEERQAIIDLALADTPRRAICRGLGRGNNYYSVVQQVLNEEGL